MLSCRNAGFLASREINARRIAADVIRAEFPARSEHEMCITAARFLKTSPDTVRRILREETDAKWSLILPLLSLHYARKGIDLLGHLEVS